MAPIVQDNATTRTVALGAGTWYPLWGAAISVDGGADGSEINASASTLDIPAFVPAGTLLVLWPDGVDTTQSAAARPSVLTAAEVGDDREVWLWPGTAVNAEVGRWHDEHGAAEAPTWTWSGRAVDSAPASATWNGAPLALTVTTDAVVATVVGDGTLAFAGGGSLVIARGHPAAQVTVRLAVR